MANQIFKKNKKWWNEPDGGKIHDCSYVTGYSRDNVLNENPLFADLIPMINKYVITIDGQEAHIKSFDFDNKDDELCGTLIRQLIDRCFANKSLNTIIGKYARALYIPGKTHMTQRFYLLMLYEPHGCRFAPPCGSIRLKILGLDLNQHFV